MFIFKQHALKEALGIEGTLFCFQRLRVKGKYAMTLIGCNISSVVLHCQLKQWNCAMKKTGSNISSVVPHCQLKQ